jgi:hypothetical protein
MRISLAVAVAALIVSGAPVSVSARPGDWGGPGWGGPGWGGGYAGSGDSLTDRQGHTIRRGDPREGRVQVTRFVASDVPTGELGHGAVTVTSLAPPQRPDLPGDAGDGPSLDGAQDYLAQSARAPFEAAVVDRLVVVGYDTLHPDPTGGQLAEVRVSREVLVPAEVKRSPVRGTAAMEVGTRGSAYGLGVNVDMTRPRTALVSTRLDTRIKDRATGKVLWEGHSQIATRDGDDKWNDGAIAARLAEALFDDFTHATG